LGVVEKVYPLHAQWNDFVANSNLSEDVWAQSDLPCNLSALGGTPDFNSCLNGAEIMRINTGLPSCEDLSLQEQLGAFDWRCQMRNNEAVFLTRSLKLRKGLSDLITPQSWKQNSVSILKKDSVIIQSLPVSWWSNKILLLPDNSSSPGLALTEDTNGRGQIFYHDSDRLIRPYNLQSRAAVVSLNGATLKPMDIAANDAVCNPRGAANPLSCMLNSFNQDYIWIEANFAQTPTSLTTNALTLYGNRFPRIFNTNINGALPWVPFTSGLWMYATNYATVRHLNVDGVQTGMNLNAANTAGFFEDLSIQSVSIGLTLSSFNNRNILHGLTVKNSGQGFQSSGSGTAIVTGISTFNLGSSNALQQGFSEPIILNSVLAVAVGTNAINPALMAVGDNLTLSNIAIFQSPVAIHASGSNNKYTGTVILGNNGTDCIADGGTSGLIDRTCADTFTEGNNSYSGQLSTSVLRPNRSIAESFTSDSSLKSTDTVIRNISGTGATQNESFVVGQPCPAAVSGNRATTSVDATFKFTYLENAVELMLDGSGNDNGLCESGETCVYSPNIGAYQGHGPLAAGACVFENGIVRDVKIFSFTQNGF
jgi:hypothetical protein